MTTAAMTTKIEFEPTPAGIDQAREELDRFAALFGDDGPDAAGKGVKPTPPHPGPSPSDEAPRAVYRSATEGSRTRELLKALPSNKADALTPTEIGKLLRPNDDGSALHSGQVRAVMRNEKKIEQTLKKRGVIADDREVVIGDFTRYEDEGCGRYYISADDRAILQSL